jgi:hypothetical protein
MPAYYQRLAEYLTALPCTTPIVTLTFSELGTLLGRPLPASAWGRSWWMTRAGTTAGSWPVTGWRVAAVSVSGGREAVTFARTDATRQTRERSRAT